MRSMSVGRTGSANHAAASAYSALGDPLATVGGAPAGFTLPVPPPPRLLRTGALALHATAQARRQPVLATTLAAAPNGARTQTAQDRSRDTGLALVIPYDAPPRARRPASSGAAPAARPATLRLQRKAALDEPLADRWHGTLVDNVARGPGVHTTSTADRRGIRQVHTAELAALARTQAAVLARMEYSHSCQAGAGDAGGTHAVLLYAGPHA
jgi:hypothetical protein